MGGLILHLRLRMLNSNFAFAETWILVFGICFFLFFGA